METTSNLMKELNDLDCSPDAFKKFCRRHPNDTHFQNLQSYLQHYLAEHPHLSQNDVIRKANASKDYANQYFNGHRKHPDKYKLLPVCIAMGMNLRETNRALTLAGQAQLNIHNHFDAAIIFCINKKYSVEQTNAFLLENDLECI